MKKIIKHTAVFFILLFMIISCGKNSVTKIYVNQIGYFPKQVKYATVVSQADRFKLFSITENKVILKKKLTEAQYWQPSGEYVKTADFSEIDQPGSYKIVVDGKDSPVFKISADIYEDISKAAIKAFYYQRASTALPQKYAVKWARQLGLPDTAVIIHQSAATLKRPAGTIISAPGGWFDAGDYNKYTVNSGITTYTLTLLYELFPDHFKNLFLNIPENGNNTADLLDEILWNARWMMKMQDPSDGSVYHKLTCKNFQGYVMPDEVTAKRYIVGKSTAAALDFAASMAHLSVVVRKNNPELTSFSDSCLNMAKKAWQWAVKNPTVYFKNPEDVHTGEYADNHLSDNFFWAGCELYFAANEPSYLRNINKTNEMDTDTLYWARVANLGILTAMTGDAELKKYLLNNSEIEKTFNNSIEKIDKNIKKSPYKISLNVFKWGSNANLLNQTLMLLSAYKLSGDKKYLNGAITNTDYILGRNPLNICYVTDFGASSPQNIHHRICEADGIKEPIPGFVVGGPNPYYLQDCGKEKYPSLLPAKCYVDDVCSYSTNEIAINWNAPLAFVLSALNNLSRK